MLWMVLQEFNIPLCYGKLPRPKKNNFQNFFKKFSIFWILPWQNLNVPLFPQYSHDHQKIFSQILVGNFTISQFWCLFFYLHRPADLGRSIPGTVLARSDRLRWSVADRRNIAQIPDIPMRRFWCPDLSPCSGDGIRAHFSSCLSCWSYHGVFAEFQSAQIKGYNKRIFAPVNA